VVGIERRGDLAAVFELPAASLGSGHKSVSRGELVPGMQPGTLAGTSGGKFSQSFSGLWIS
jgi:hypothetical protein